MASYDLRVEPWIPVISKTGELSHVGFRDALVEAHEVRAVQDSIPTVEFGIYRLLTAMVLDIFEPSGPSDLAQLIRNGCFDASSVNAYLDKWSGRFDLFDERYPFLQTSAMTESPGPLAGILPAIPSGTNVTHFHHAHEDDFSVGPPQAARLLASIPCFMTAGGSGYSPSINGAPPWYVLITGESLFETLCRNSCVVPLPNDQGMGKPRWRETDPVERGDRISATLLEGLSWSPRRVQLLPDGPGRCDVTGEECSLTVRSMRFAPGHRFVGAHTDPNVAYRIGNKGPLPLRPQNGREIWRDTGPLAFLREHEYVTTKGQFRYERPMIVSQFAELVNLDVIDRTPPLRLTVYGMRTDMKMKVFEWQKELLALPKQLMWEARFHRVAQEAIDGADQVAFLIRRNIQSLYPREGSGNKKANQSLVDRTQRDYWARLRPDFEGRFLPSLAEGGPELSDDAIVEWRQSATGVARDCFEHAIDGNDTDAAALRRLATARQSFYRGLHRVTFGQKDVSEEVVQ